MDLRVQAGLARPRRRLIQVTPLEAHLDKAPQTPSRLWRDRLGNSAGAGHVARTCRHAFGIRGGTCRAAGAMKAKNTHKRSFLRELMLLCKRYDLRFDEDVVHGNLVISQLDSMGIPEEFIEWLEDADDYEATELEKKKDPG